VLGLPAGWVVVAFAPECGGGGGGGRCSAAADRAVPYRFSPLLLTEEE